MDPTASDGPQPQVAPRRRRGLVVLPLTLALLAPSASAAWAAESLWQTTALSDTASNGAVPGGFIDSSGSTTAIWLEGPQGARRVAVASRGALTKGWALPSSQTISLPGENVAGLATAANAHGDALAVWHAGGVVRESRRSGPTGPWSAPRTLRATNVAISRLSVAFNDQGDAIVAWLEETNLWATHAMGDGGYAAPSKIAPYPTTRMDHMFTGIDAQGSAVVAWDQLQTGSDGSSHLGVFVARRNAQLNSWTRTPRTDLPFDTAVTSLAVSTSGPLMIGVQRRSGSVAKSAAVPYTPVGNSLVAGPEKLFGATGVATSQLIAGMNAGGDAVVAYLSSADQVTYDLRVAFATRATQSWSASQTVSSGPQPREIAVALSQTGGAVVGWVGADRRVRAAFRRAVGLAWTAPVTLTPTGATTGAPGLSERDNHYALAWVEGSGASATASVALLDTVAPHIVPHVPRTVRVKVPARMTIEATDTLSTIAAYGWTFWDNSPAAAGPVVVHTFKRAGTYRVTLKATDAAGNPTRTQVVVRAINYAAVRGMPIVGTSLTCHSSIAGARVSWRRGARVVSRRMVYVLRAADLGAAVSCVAATTKQSATAPARRIPRLCTIPVVVGRPVATARKALQLRGCRVATTTVSASPARVGTVIWSSVPSGRRVANGTVVRLRVGRQ